MAASTPVHLVSFGAVTSVGASARVAMAAAQVGLARIAIVSASAADDDATAAASDDNSDDHDDEPADACHAARLSTLALAQAPARGQALLRLAIDQALAPLPAAEAGTLLVCVAAPPRFDAGLAVARQLVERFTTGKLPELETDLADGSAVLSAIEQVMGRLSGGAFDFALVAAVDVRSDAATLAELWPSARVIGPGRSFGQVPGEGASALLLASERGLRRLGVSSRGALLAAVATREPDPLGSSRPCLGTGVTQAVRQVLAKLPPDALVDGVTCDLNGERFRTDEWGFTIPRVLERLREPELFVAPATSWGDCGAANGGLLLALAASQANRGANPGAHLLVWTSSDGDQRAAALVCAAAPTEAADDPPPVAGAAPPAWARELDGQILSEMTEECAFRYQQREFLIDRLAGEELVPDWRAVEQTEGVLAALARGLAESGVQARDIVTAAVDPESPGSVYTAVRTLLEAGRTDAATELAALHAPADPKLAEAVLLAFQQVSRPSATPERSLPALLAAGPALAVVAVQLAASAGLAISPSVLGSAAAAVTPKATVGFLRALAELATPAAGSALERWADAADPAVRQELALAQIRTGAVTADILLARAATDPALLLPAALVVDARRIGWFAGLASAAGGAASILALAVAGDSTAVPWLLDRLGDEATGATAACALEILLGGAPIEEKEIPDEDESAPPRRVRRVSQDRRAWSAIADPVRSRHPAALRLRGGAPAVAAANLRLLARPHLPILARRYLAHELAVRWGMKRPFDARALVRSQREWLSAAERTALPLAPGSWDLRG